jgi:hypothetical protein
VAVSSASGDGEAAKRAQQDLQQDLEQDLEQDRRSAIRSGVPPLRQEHVMDTPTRNNRFSLTTVVALLALFVGLSGTAYAAGTVATPR